MNKKVLPYNNENGYTLAIVLIVIMVFSILGMSIMAMSMNSVKMSAGEEKDQSVFYIAEAALTVEMKNIENNINESYNENKDETSFFDDLSSKILSTAKPSTAKFDDSPGYNPKAEIMVMQLNNTNPRSYKVTSTGYIDKKKRVVEQEFSVKWEPKSSNLEEVAILVKEQITLDSALISGNIGTIKSGPNSILIGSGGLKDLNYQNYKGEIYIPNGLKPGEKAIIKPTWMNGIPDATVKDLGAFMELPPFPTFPKYPRNTEIPYTYDKSGKGTDTITLNKNTEMDYIHVGGSQNLIIDIGDSNRELVLNELYLYGSGKIFIKGSGILKLFVKTRLDIDEGMLNPQSLTEKASEPVITNNDAFKNHIKKLEIYYKGTEKFTIDGASLRIYASLYAENADIHIKGTAALYGNIFTGGRSFQVTGTGNVQPSLYFSPNAVFEVSGSGQVSGTIISKSIIVKGMGKVQFQNQLITDGPFAPDSGSGGKVGINKKVFKEK